jgi:hypothetical protein
VHGERGGYGWGTGGHAIDGSGVVGESDNYTGVWGSGAVYGVYSDGNAVVQGDLSVSGTVSKGGGSFKIDHPLDPANKYLYHSFVESPDMMNVYNGNTKLGAGGEATIQLPDWFQSLNQDFRYQLTAIGAAAPGLFIKSGVNQNRFVIAGGSAGQDVSWQVTGIRHDAWAKANRIPVEEAKAGTEKGRFLHPEAHGKAKALGVAAQLRANGRSA